MSEEDVLLWLEAEDRKRTAAVRQMLIDEGRQDLADDLDRRIRDIRLGVDSARNCWHSISAAQRRTLEILGESRAITTSSGGGYVAIGCPGGYAVKVGRLPTLRALCAHELIAPNGPALDPERDFVLTERGRFVLDRGRPNDPPLTPAPERP